MGQEENYAARGALLGGPSDEIRKGWAQLEQTWMRERAEAQDRELRKLADALADQQAVWTLAEFYLPADIREMAARFKMDETLPEMWRAAFIAGWRAAHRATQPRPNIPEQVRPQ